MIVGTIHIPKQDSVSSSAAILFLADFLNSYDGDFYLDPLNYLNCQHNCFYELKKNDGVADLFSSKVEEEKNVENEINKIKDNLTEKDKNSIILDHKSDGIISADLSANSSLKEHSNNSRDSSSEEHSCGSSNGDGKVNQQKCRFSNLNNNSLSSDHINDDHSGRKSNDSDQYKPKSRGIDQGHTETCYITTLTENVLRNKNKKINKDKIFHKKYLQLPITCTKITNKSKDFSLDSSYQSLLTTIQIFGNRLRSIFVKNLAADSINNNLNRILRRGDDKCKNDDESKNDDKSKNDDFEIKFSIATANICLKKFINCMNKQEKYFVDKLLILMRSHNLGLCTYPHSETTGWCEK